MSTPIPCVAGSHCSWIPSTFSAPPCSPSCKECLGHQPPLKSNPPAMTPFCRNLGQLCHLLQLSSCHTSLIPLDLLLTCCSLCLCSFAASSFPLMPVVPSPTQGRFRQLHTTPTLLWTRTDHPWFSEELMRPSVRGYNSTQLFPAQIFQDTEFNPASKQKPEANDGFNPCRAGSAAKQSETGEAGSRCTTNSHKEAFFLQKFGRGSNFYINGRIWILNLWEATSCCMEEML